MGVWVGRRVGEWVGVGDVGGGRGAVERGERMRGEWYEPGAGLLKKGRLRAWQCTSESPTEHACNMAHALWRHQFAQLAGAVDSCVRCQIKHSLLPSPHASD